MRNMSSMLLRIPLVQVKVLQSLQGGAQGVLRLHGVYEDEDQVLLVTELCEGGHLGKYLQVRAAPPRVCLLPPLCVKHWTDL